MSYLYCCQSNFEKQKTSMISGIAKYNMLCGARGESRTLTPARAADFESAASTIPPLGLTQNSVNAYNGSRQL